MKLRWIFVSLGLALTVIAPCSAAEKFAAIAVAGDSISKAFNGQSAFLCPNSDQEQYNWATSDTNGTDFCSPGREAVFSIDERMECEQGRDVSSPSPNQARSGAQMLKDYVAQANAIKSWITSQPPPSAGAGAPRAE